MSSALESFVARELEYIEFAAKVRAEVSRMEFIRLQGHYGSDQSIRVLKEAIWQLDRGKADHEA